MSAAADKWGSTEEKPLGHVDLSENPLSRIMRAEAWMQRVRKGTRGGNAWVRQADSQHKPPIQH